MIRVIWLFVFLCRCRVCHSQSFRGGLRSGLQWVLQGPQCKIMSIFLNSMTLWRWNNERLLLWSLTKSTKMYNRIYFSCDYYVTYLCNPKCKPNLMVICNNFTFWWVLWVVHMNSYNLIHTFLFRVWPSRIYMTFMQNCIFSWEWIIKLHHNNKHWLTAQHERTPSQSLQ